MQRIREGKYYEVASSSLADWLDRQGIDTWWNVDGDPLLTGRLTFPCPVDELSQELRTINRPMIVQAHADDRNADGQSIDSRKLNDLVSELATAASVEDAASDRLLYLSWKDSAHDWLLIEDSESAKQFRGELAPESQR